MERFSTKEVQMIESLQPLVEHYGKLMIASCTGAQSFERLQTTVEVSEEGNKVVLFKELNCQRATAQGSD